MSDEKNIYVSKSSRNNDDNDNKKPKKSKAPKAVLIILLVLALCTGGFYAYMYWKDNFGGSGGNESSSGSESQSASESGSLSQPESEASQNPDSSGSGTDAGGDEGDAFGKSDYNAIALPDEMRGMWISFLELRDMDTSSEESYRAAVSQMLEGCRELNLNTVIFAVRPFGDAIYPSEIFPWSHLISGAQGQDPGFDPLKIAIDEAHARGLRFEAWINPYRVQHPTNGPETLSDDNPAIANPGWVKSQGGLWYDPGLPEVREMVIGGVAEIVEGYEVDGIHFDDYFYPEGNTADFDADSYALHGGGTALAVWRRENVNTLVKDVYRTIKDINPGVSFGISPEGNNDNNYNKQYSDVKLWLAENGYVDYIMPQIYWGFNYIKGEKTDAAFNNKLGEWASYASNPSVRLYCGLGAYRIGVGDGGDGDMKEWNSGHNLADMVKAIRENDKFNGFSIFRYGFLLSPYDGGANSELAQKEAEALKTLLNQ